VAQHRARPPTPLEILPAADHAISLIGRALATVEIGGVPQDVPECLAVPASVVHAGTGEAADFVIDCVVEDQDGVVEGRLFVRQGRGVVLAPGVDLADGELAPGAAPVVVRGCEGCPADVSVRVARPVNNVGCG